MRISDWSSDVCSSDLGTLTMGKPDLVAVTPHGGVAEEELLTLAAAVERGSEHPLGAAIVAGAEARGVRHEEAGGLSSTTGEGVEANVGERRVANGNEKRMRRIGISDENWLGTAQEGRAQGRTVID